MYEKSLEATVVLEFVSFNSMNYMLKFTFNFVSLKNLLNLFKMKEKTHEFG